MLQLYNRNKPAAVIERPSYLLEPLRQIKDLLRAGILAQGKPIIHRKTYRHWIQEVTLPANVKEMMFLFNQRLLPTRTRCHRFDSLADENCQLCHQFPETDEHLVIYCPLRNKVWSWLEGTVRRHGCKTPPENFIRGDIGPTRHRRTIFTLVAAYIYATWKERSRNRIPTEVEVENLWVSILPPPQK
ncbi:hypothetical protein GHT06_001728 [Daphnia sinensis]|uniref:Reverse transcriptase zinc-binding domain-containing protein n=1 Tax=Daphnia sinensis TaxID=1820382 RepID=A0AAD5KWA3_9CRUS|nr:hypothetical protein GHT06_005767 [Daphnia sinensis]KAI9550910.1 hypothetical protein GHT06_004534 [Daphnia sinensis]KAI9550921.1 hypothetical protein GHT06_001728 [Daphnia sinensis]